MALALCLEVAATSRNQEEHEQQKREHRREGTGVSSEQQQQQHQQQQWIALSLPLQPFHYSNGQLNLRCNAQIPGIYSSMNELQLGAGLREPVPERGYIKNMGMYICGLLSNKTNARYVFRIPIAASPQKTSLNPYSKVTITPNIISIILLQRYATNHFLIGIKHLPTSC
ncbi:hypothetical protein HZH68_013270 [Vespula germanica]|uniref:Uncharacterized protein n=1 Tax=Vespula germanica TaxID=30212 RepID=A0A834JDE1_VESGE|nr:hypothetical protein HZH68_013270 [Vespula germanica]